MFPHRKRGRALNLIMLLDQLMIKVVFAERLPVLRSVMDDSIHAWFDLERVGAPALAYEVNKLLVIENVQVVPRQAGEVGIKVRLNCCTFSNRQICLSSTYH